MDFTEKTHIDLDDLREKLHSLNTMNDTVAISQSNCVTGAISGFSFDDTITLSNTAGTSYTFSSSPNITISNGAYTTSAFGNVWGGNPLKVDNSGLLDLTGDNADIKINGKSLMSAIEALEQRLNILTPNPKLEAEWDELRELGERYRALEKQCKEKAAMWEKLKSMPPPEIL